MRLKDTPQAKRIAQAIEVYAKSVRPLPGLRDFEHVNSLVGQMVESIRRVQYVKLQLTRRHGGGRADPASDTFDPILGAIVQKAEGKIDEAVWLTFIATICGKHLELGWRLARLIFGGNGTPWTWERARSNPEGLRTWIGNNCDKLAPDGRAGFGNHRKYESIRSDASRPTGRVLELYVKWVVDAGGHEDLFNLILTEGGGDRGKAFDIFYTKAEHLMGLGRMGRFDFLTMLGKLELIAIEPAIPYLTGATGPLSGARLLFYGQSNAPVNAKQLDRLVAELGQYLQLGMQVMEDSICNWQKSPTRFIPFRG